MGDASDSFGDVLRFVRHGLSGMTLRKGDIARSRENCQGFADTRSFKIEPNTVMLCLEAPADLQRTEFKSSLLVLHPEEGPCRVEVGSIVPHTKTPCDHREIREFIFYIVVTLGGITYLGTVLTLDSKLRKFLHVTPESRWGYLAVTRNLWYDMVAVARQKILKVPDET